MYKLGGVFMFKRKCTLIISTGVILLELISSNSSAASLYNPNSDEVIPEESTQYRTIDELKKELQEQRKIIEDQKLQQLKEKEREKEKEKDLESDKNPTENKSEDSGIKKVEPEKTNEEIPTLIVRLRGKHSSKYLCNYNMLIDDHELNRSIITDYNILLKKPSLKVRANEIINFQFSREPQKLRVYRWGEEDITIKNKKGSIRVPDIEGKIVVAIEATYKEGNVRYAIVLDIRK